MGARIPYIPYNADVDAAFAHLGVTVNTQYADGRAYWDPNEYANWLSQAQANSWDYDDGEEVYDQLPTTFSFIYWSVEGHTWY